METPQMRKGGKRMVTYSQPIHTTDTVVYEFYGKSTDTKPTIAEYPDMANGSTFMEMNTKTLYFYDADSDNWI